jgi:cytochrome P450
LDDLLRIKIYSPLRAWFGRTDKVTGFTSKKIREHAMSAERGSPDFLSRFLQSKEKYPDLIDEAQLGEYVRTNISAGSDTTAIALREIVFRLLSDSKSLDRFMDEVKIVLKARLKDDDFEKPITWAEGCSMIYFQACLKECLRVHSPLGQLIPREVPKGGVELCGKFLPEGTIVGCNAWTVHRDKKFYGEDADEFKPERWIINDTEKVSSMEHANFAFGGGPRVCVGKNIALLEINKFVPELFRRFELHMVDPARYKLLPGWLVLQDGLDVTLKRRDQETLLA